MVQFKGEEAPLEGTFLKPGDIAMNFMLVNDKLENVTLEHFRGKTKVIITVVSLDTGVCATEAMRVEDVSREFPDVAFLIVTRDLPFAASRFCLQNKLGNVTVLSDIRPSCLFGRHYGVQIHKHKLEGLFARSVIVLNVSDKVIYSELVPEITEEPNYEALKSILLSHRMA
ncbi:MAG: hypothetical protein A3F09_00980 [Chlamydiae bacterium RIFCSPHIGHO2_12_FULL_49_11]|nr:MAG: hypothetical protein A3F09_00980 [Chlamydiae bacterium RIFCSPHIGHO2_12_FULL_49_11]